MVSEPLLIFQSVAVVVLMVSVPVPVPVSGMDWATGALLEMVTCAAKAAAREGLNATEMVQVPFTATDAPQVLVWGKFQALAPVTAIPVMSSGAVPELVRVTVWAALVDSAAWVKVRDGALRRMAGAVEVAVPVRAMVSEAGDPLSAMATEAVKLPAAVGEKLTEMGQLATATSV